jgi:hypothetical protein
MTRRKIVGLPRKKSTRVSQIIKLYYKFREIDDITVYPPDDLLELVYNTIKDRDYHDEDVHTYLRLYRDTFGRTYCQPYD